MVKTRAGFLSTVAACICWYVVIPAQNTLAAGKELNLDLAQDSEVVPMPSMIGLFFKLVVSLVIITGLAYLVMRLMRKNMRVLSRTENIKVLDHYAFSLNKGIYITQIAGQVCVLGVTDHNISLITEINDKDLAEQLILQAKEKEEEPVIPAGVLDRIVPKMRRSVSGKSTFNTHIQNQIKKLQSMVEPRGGIPREDDRDE